MTEQEVPPSIGQYEFRGVIGRGTFAEVMLAMDRNTKQMYACKVIQRNRFAAGVPLRFENEVRIVQQLTHPGIIQLYDLLQDQDFYYIIMELCPKGELYEYIIDNIRLSELEARYFCRQILEALSYMHSCGAVHRDIKPENLLLTDDGHIKLTDFGLSRFVNNAGLADTPCGSPCYASPECIRGGSYDGRKSDVWSVGVVCYAMVTGELPWSKSNQVHLFDQIRKAEYRVPDYVSAGCREFLRGLIEPNPERRLTAAQALEHPWVSTAPRHREIMRPKEFQISLRKVDQFFGREVSEEMIEDNVMIRSCSMHGGTIEKTLARIVPNENGQTARVVATSLIIPKKMPMKKPLFVKKTWK